MQTRRRRGGAALAMAGLGGALAALSAGCGSSSNSATAHVRVRAFSPNAGTAGVLVGGEAGQGAVGGDLNFGEGSAYQYIGEGVAYFYFSTTASVPANITTPPRQTLQLNNGSYYSAYLIGRSDVLGVADPRFLQTVVTGDRGAAGNYSSGTPYSDPPSGQANVRVLNAAPDAGFTAPRTAGAVDVLVNGRVAFAGVAYPKLPTGTNSVTAAPPATAYQALPGGTLSVQVNVAGTSTVLVPATSISVSGGQAYTLVVTEPTITPTYGLLTQSDQP